jgi:hypothetical protein
MSLLEALLLGVLERDRYAKDKRIALEADSH